MKVIATICSRKKRTDEELLPACERYQGDHVRTALQLAEATGLPYYILSGKYGLIEASTPIPYYDHLLTEDEVAALSEQIETQLRASGVMDIDFYVKNEPAWAPYRAALETAAKHTGARVRVLSLPVD